MLGVRAVQVDVMAESASAIQFETILGFFRAESVVLPFVYVIASSPLSHLPYNFLRL